MTNYGLANGGATRRAIPRLAFVASLLLLCVAPVSAQSVAEFYENRAITILVGSGPGGVTDTSARVIAGYLEDHIPGQPTVIVKNMPGGGSVTMANHLYRSAARDGTMLGYSLPALILAQLMEPNRAKYDGREFSWIGSAVTATNMISVLDTAPARTIEAARETEIIIGASGRGSLLYQLPAMAGELLGLKIRVITGYQGSSEITLAMERGEVHGQAAGLDYWSLARPDWLADGRLAHLAYIGPADDRAPDTPHLSELVSSERDKALVDFLEIGSNMGWPLFAPPEVPADRLEALRQAFAEMLQNEAFSGTMLTSMRTPLKPTLGAELEVIVNTALNTPESVVTEAKDLLGL